jgi:hypothetical protein
MPSARCHASARCRCQCQMPNFKLRNVRRTMLRQGVVWRSATTLLTSYLIHLTGYEPAARKGVECRLGGSIIKNTFRRAS